MIRHAYRGFLYFFLAVWIAGRGSPLFAQARASVDRHRILIGEQFLLTLEAPSNTTLPAIDTVPHFEILEKMDPQVSGQMVRQTYRMTSFDSGSWVIPSFAVSRQFRTDTIRMHVTFSDFDPSQDYHDIKDIVPVDPASPADWIWWISLGLAVITLLVVWLVTRKKSRGTPLRPPPDAYKEALRRLEEIRRSELPDRSFYSETVDVFRMYVFRKKGILSLQKTTDDLVLQLRDLQMRQEGFAALTQALRLADFVKFAKYQPAEQDKIFFMQTIAAAIDELEKGG